MPNRLDGYELLLVEDEFLILLDLQYAFEQEGAVVVTATTVEEGLEAARDSYAVAVLDVRLPDGEIYPVADQLATLGVPLVFHSGHAQQELLEEQFPGATALSKPAPETMLIEAVARQAAT
ncbi:MAG: response regulator [Pseudomonadota bacterium]